MLSIHDAAQLAYDARGGDDAIAEPLQTGKRGAAWLGLWHAIGAPGVPDLGSLEQWCARIADAHRGIGSDGARVPGVSTDQARDLVFSGPKSVGVALAAAFASTRKDLCRAPEEAQTQAVARTLAAMEEEALFILSVAATAGTSVSLPQGSSPCPCCTT